MGQGGVIDEDEKQVTAAYNSIIAQLARAFFRRVHDTPLPYTYFWLVGRFPDHVKASEDLQAFGILNEARLYKLMTSCMARQVDLKLLTKSMASITFSVLSNGSLTCIQNEFSRRLEQSSSDIHATMTGLLRRNSLHIINTSSVPTLVKHIQRRDNSDLRATDSARIILVAVAKQCPAIFKGHVAEFCRALSEEGNVPLVEVSLQALAAVARWDENGAPNDK
jgi:sister-chromatid-cohesion protein PDS5